jgi:DNA mismatch repair protein MutS
MKTTPMMQQYENVKSAHPDALVFWRLGDFYELFDADAETGAHVLGLVLTKRGGRDMCGVPHHARDGYVKRLVDAGYRVAIVEQVGEIQKGELVNREVIRIVTAGTVTDDNQLTPENNNYIAAVGAGCVSWCDITTGQFFSQCIKSDPADLLEVIIPAEVIFHNNELFAHLFLPQTALQAIREHFGVTSLSALGMPDDSPIVQSTGALLGYLKLTQKQKLSIIDKITIVCDDDNMQLDKATIANLELTRTQMTGKREGSLLWLLNRTTTALGARLLSNIIVQPLQDLTRINRRLDAVEQLSADTISTQRIVQILSKTFDIYRIVGRIARGAMTPNDCLTLRSSFAQIESLKKALNVFDNRLLTDINTNLNPMSDVRKLLTDAIADDGAVRIGYSSELDKVRKIQSEGLSVLDELERKERAECDIKQIKVSFNRMNGYHFEIPKAVVVNVPYRFQRIGTTLNSERFVTDELRELSTQILNADSTVVELEGAIFDQLTVTLLKYTSEMIVNAEAIAQLDVLCSFALVSVENGLVRPRLNDKGIIKLTNARHPVIEKLSGSFVANDCKLEPNRNTIVITGPNMAGKSVYMKTVAINVLLAHFGCFVAADYADIALTDRIATRMGIYDDAVTGRSSFMVEMNEASAILRTATRRTLILLDEIGRGTGSRDGYVLARAIVEHITDEVRAPTLFATHFHELAELGKQTREHSIINRRAVVQRTKSGIQFLHRVVEGYEDNSFGVEVARLSGLPCSVIGRAQQLLGVTSEESLIRTNTGEARCNRVKSAPRVLTLLEEVEAKKRAQTKPQPKPKPAKKVNPYYKHKGN